MHPYHRPDILYASPTVAFQRHQCYRPLSLGPEAGIQLVYDVNLSLSTRHTSPRTPFKQSLTLEP